MAQRRLLTRRTLLVLVALALAAGGTIVAVTSASSTGAAPFGLRWRDVQPMITSTIFAPADVATVRCPAPTSCDALVTRGLETSVPWLLVSFDPATDAAISVHRVPKGAGTLLSCPSVSTCVLAGSSVDTTTDAGSHWIKATTSGNTVTSLQCATATRCIVTRTSPGGTVAVAVGNPQSDTFHDVKLPGDATQAASPMCLPTGTCVLTAARDFRPNLWVYESDDWGATWQVHALPGPRREFAVAACASDRRCASGATDLLQNLAGIDVQTDVGPWRVADLHDAKNLLVNGIFGQESMTCSTQDCVIGYWPTSGPSSTSVLTYGNLATNRWHAVVVHDDPEAQLTPGGSFVIDGSCVVQWYASGYRLRGAVRRGCPR